MDISDLERFNPWWRTGEVRAEWLLPYKRALYTELSRFVPKRQILLIQGLRRMGKTTLLFQLINELLAKTAPKKVLYFSFDELAFDLKEVLELYQKQVLGAPFENAAETVYLFCDEIQKVADWENKLKTYYDLYPNIKFVVSGSASASLRRRSKESLAGRIVDFTLEPLSFEEFLELKGKDLREIKAQPDLWAREVLPLFYQYLKFGTFPELLNESDEEAAKRYILNNVIDRIIYKDIPEEFGVKDVELLRSIVYLLAKNPGAIINFRELSQDLHRDERTIANYYEYLEFSFLLGFVFNYRGSPLASARKMKKAYFATPNIIFAFSAELDRVLPAMLENVIFMKSKVRFFYRNSYEVDFVIPRDKGLTAIEVKSSSTETKQLRKFMRKFGARVENAFMVTFEQEGKDGAIPIIPAWKFLLGVSAGDAR